MFCVKCGNKLSNRDSFCGRCGHKQCNNENTNMQPKSVDLKKMKEMDIVFAALKNSNYMQTKINLKSIVIYSSAILVVIFSFFIFLLIKYVGYVGLLPFILVGLISNIIFYSFAIISCMLSLLLVKAKGSFRACRIFNLINLIIWSLELFIYIISLFFALFQGNSPFGSSFDILSLIIPLIIILLFVFSLLNFIQIQKINTVKKRFVWQNSQNSQNMHQSYVQQTVIYTRR